MGVEKESDGRLCLLLWVVELCLKPMLARGVAGLEVFASSDLLGVHRSLRDYGLA